MTLPVVTATTGDRCRSLTLASADGNAWIRPIANEVRLNTFTPALELARVELMIAKKTRTQNRPYSARATPSQDALPVPVVNFEKPAGPNATSIAYVVNTYRAPISNVDNSTASCTVRRGLRAS